MAKAVQYVTRVVAQVVVSEVLVSGGEMPVGEFVVRTEFGKEPRQPDGVQEQVEAAMARAGKAARTMAAGVANTERNRLK